MRIVIAYDGSTCAQEAVADLAGAGLPDAGHALVLHVGEASAGADAPVDAGVAEEGAAMLRAILPDWTVVAATSTGSVAWEIIKRGEGDRVQSDVVSQVWGDAPADLIVVGSRGYGGLLGPLKSWVLGSVSHRVLMASRCSVRVARGEHFRATTLADSSLPYTGARIVVGVDGSDDSIAAVQAVAMRDWPVSTQVLVVHYWNGHRETMHAPGVWGGDDPEIRSASSAEAQAMAVTSRAAVMLRTALPALSVTTLVKAGDPKYAILDDAREWGDRGADSIFVGARGIGKIERFILGSVSTAIAMHAHCSVEVVHPHPRT